MTVFLLLAYDLCPLLWLWLWHPHTLTSRHLGYTGYSITTYLFPGQMLYPKFNSFLEVIFAERLWQCSGRPGMINTYSNYTLGVDNQKCTTYNWHRTIKVVYNQIFSSIIVSYWIWFFHYSNSEMFGQRMIILVQLESVQRMSSCVCLISSKWIFPPVREKTGVILTHNQTACLRLLINEMVSQSANFSLFHWVRESVFSYLGVISTVLVFNHPCQ